MHDRTDSYGKHTRLLVGAVKDTTGQVKSEACETELDPATAPRSGMISRTGSYPERAAGSGMRSTQVLSSLTVRRGARPGALRNVPR